LEQKVLKTKEFKAMIAAGKSRLEQNAEYVNSLNVFPVPDGDTGTNMNLSFTSGADYVKTSDSNHVGEVSKALSKGLLMGARGNSGVILSQLFRGFSKAIENQETLDSENLAEAFQGGVNTAYNAVMKPVEGTILTVARESAQAGKKKAEESDDIIEVMEAVLQEAQTALDNTPEQLEVLKEVGVVDSGGQGLVFIYQGFLSSLTGEDPVEDDNEVELEDLVRAEHHKTGVHEHMNAEDIEYGYCTEIMVRIGEGETVDSEFNYDEFRNHLDTLGDSLLVVADDEIIKVHVHTETPGEVMNYGQKFGSLINIKVDNMREQHSALSNESDNQPQKSTAKKECVIIAVAVGEGVKTLFESLGVDHVLQGGQTMNPSTEDITKAMEQNPADSYIILPNNKNVFMAAKQATEMIDSPAVVVETKFVQQGLTAMLGYNESLSLEENQESMTENIEYVTSGEITNSIRDTKIEGLSIKKDDFMGLVDGNIKVSDSELNKVLMDTIDQMMDEESEIVTLIFGEDIEEKEAQEISDQIENNYEDIEVQIHNGGQPVYPYLISVE